MCDEMPRRRLGAGRVNHTAAILEKKSEKSSQRKGK